MQLSNCPSASFGIAPKMKRPHKGIGLILCFESLCQVRHLVPFTTFVFSVKHDCVTAAAVASCNYRMYPPKLVHVGWLTKILIIVFILCLSMAED